MTRAATRTRPRPPTPSAVAAALHALRPADPAPASPPKRTGRPPAVHVFSRLSQRERHQISMGHALHGLRAFLLTRCDRGPELLRHVHALEHAIDQLCPPDGDRVRRRNGSR